MTLLFTGRHLYSQFFFRKTASTVFEANNFFRKHSLLCESQFGIWKERSIALALLKQTEFLINAFEQTRITLGIIIYFTKAFDHVSHTLVTLLMSKLEHYAIRGSAFELFSS